jgi:plasmid stability protein
MAAITIRNLSDETHRALKAMAAAHGCSAEAEVRQILDDAVAGRADIGFGSRLARIAYDVGGFDVVLERDNTSSEPLDFS